MLLCLAVFAAAYLLNVITITVFYHRGLAHGAVELRPWLRRLVVRGGIWITGLDPKGWVCMHRRHHAFSDTSDDPHSPVTFGLFGVLLGQLESYERTLVGLAKGNPDYTAHVPDLDFPTHWLNRRRIWFLPYVVHALVALGLALAFGTWMLGLAYFAGMMSHPLQGWIVNALGHAVGGRNFDTPDNSRNNTLAAWLIFGEGFQNNHHAFPRSARFSYRRSEVDLGFVAVRALAAVGALDIDHAQLIPEHADALEEVSS
ncbi:MAG: acyl-CoA desaturase [Deltaproteobacteria bacterium]